MESNRTFSSQLVMIPSSRSLLSRDKRLPLDTWNQSGLQGNVFLKIKFLRLIHPEILLKELNLTTCKESVKQPVKQHLKQKGRRLVTHVKTDKNKAQFQCRHLRQGRWLRVLQYRWNYRRTTWWDSKNIRFAVRQISYSTTVLGVENSIRNTSHYLFWFSIGCYVVEQRSGDSWFVGRVKILAINSWKWFSKLRDAGREGCLYSAQDHSEFPAQEEGQHRGAESPKRGSVSTRKTDDDNIQGFELKTVLELYDVEIYQKISVPNHQKLQIMVKRSTDQKLRLRNFDARHERIESGAVVKSWKGVWKEKDKCSQGDRCSFRHETQDRAQNPEHIAATPSEPTSSRGRSVSRKRSIRGKSNHGSILRQLCRYYSKSTSTRTSGEYWHPPECRFYKNETGCKAGDKCLFPHHKVDEQPNKMAEKEQHPKKKRKRWQECCGSCEKCITIGLCITWFRCTRFSR